MKAVRAWACAAVENARSIARVPAAFAALRLASAVQSGSVASYLREFGWKDGDPVVAPVRVDTAETQAALELGIKPSLTVEQWRMRGVEPMGETALALTAALFRFDLLGGSEYWLGFDNFYAILMYNRSRNYAMAVHDLARERDRLAAVNGAAEQ